MSCGRSPRTPVGRYGARRSIKTVTRVGSVCASEAASRCRLGRAGTHGVLARKQRDARRRWRYLSPNGPLRSAGVTSSGAPLCMTTSGWTSKTPGACRTRRGSTRSPTIGPSDPWPLAAQVSTTTRLVCMRAKAASRAATPRPSPRSRDGLSVMPFETCPLTQTGSSL